MATTASESSQILDKIDDNLLSCSICLEQYKSPKTLPCLHTFCEQCLVTLVEKRKGTTTCPNCNTPFHISDAGVPKLKTNFFINSLIDIVKQRSAVVSNPGQCEGCEEKTATNRCVDCCLNFCRSCTKPHKTVPATRAHTVILLQEYKLPTPASHLLPHGNVYCNDHSENTVKFYCDTCQVPVCLECIVVRHRIPEHVHRDLQEAADEYTKQLKAMIETLRQREKKAESCKQLAKQYTHKLKAQCKVEKEKVITKMKDFTLKAQREEKRLTKELEQQYNLKVKEAELKLEDLEIKYESISSTSSYLETVVHHASPAQLVSTKTETLHRITELIAMETKTLLPELIQFQPSDGHVEYGILGLLRSDVCVSQCTVENIPEQLVKGDSVKLVVRTKDSHGKQVIPRQKVMAVNNKVIDNKDGTHCVTITGHKAGRLQIDITVGGQPIPGTPVNIPVITGLVKTIGKAGRGIGHFDFPNGIARNSHGDVFTVDFCNHRVQIMDKNGNYKSSIAFTQFENSFMPYDVAISADDKVFMTDISNHQIVVCDANGHLIRCFGKNEVENPHGIAISPFDGSVYVSDWEGGGDTTNKERHCVVKYSQSGDFIAKFGKHGRQQGEFQGPSFLTINSQGTAFVSDYNNHRIQVFNADCVFVYSFGKYGTKDGQLKCPNGIDIDKDGYLYVAEQRNNRIQKFDSSGRYICRVDRDEDGLKSPQGVTVLSSGLTCRIAVSDYDNHCIKVFAM
ncbi:tripartite motif-containing protein 2-like [Glandiceps talaboti]